MTWLQRYHLRRFVRWSLWLMPVLAIGLVMAVGLYINSQKSGNASML